MLQCFNALKLYKPSLLQEFIVSMIQCINAASPLQPFYASRLQRFDVSKLHCFKTSVLQDLLTLQCFSPLMLQRFDASMLQCFNASIANFNTGIKFQWSTSTSLSLTIIQYFKISVIFLTGKIFDRQHIFSDEPNLTLISQHFLMHLQLRRAGFEIASSLI